MSLHAENDRLSAWVGSLPEGWRCDWLKWHVDCSTARPTDEQQATLPYLSNEDIESWTGRLLREDLVPAEADSRLFKAGDVLFNKLRPYLAKVFRAEFDGVSSGELLCLRPSDRVDARYLFYVLTSHGLIDSVDAQTFGSKMPRADWEIIGHQPLPLPHVGVQQRIANFLDEKTAQIDALIDKKRALLERLTEQRQALITRAVTKGLNPDVSMTTSEIGWIGAIPSHWKVMPVKHVARLESGHTPDKKIDEYWEDCDIPWVSLNDTARLRSDDYIHDTSIRVNSLGIANSSARILPARTVVFTRDATIGEAAITMRPMAVSQHIIAWLCNELLIIPEFLLFCIYGMRQELMSITNGTTIGTIGLGDVNEIQVAVPPIAEQNRIIDYVFEGKLRAESCSLKVSDSIEKLIEYRRALVATAIAGQMELI